MKWIGWCDPDGQATEVPNVMDVGKADFAFLKSIFRRAVRGVYIPFRVGPS